MITRHLTQKLRSKKKPSSQRWLLRQMNDPYVQQAQAQGYRSRSAFKLKEMVEGREVLKPGMKVLDLGCAPGGWCQVVQSYRPACVVGVDLLAMDPLEGVDFIQGDFCTSQVQTMLAEKGPFDGIVSDAAPSSTGHHSTDLLRISGLVEIIWDISYPLLKEGGIFLVKAFHTQDIQNLCKIWRKCFQGVEYIKPQASRKGSKEIYIYAYGYRGASTVDLLDL